MHNLSASGRKAVQTAQVNHLDNYRQLTPEQQFRATENQLSLLWNNNSGTGGML